MALKTRFTTSNLENLYFLNINCFFWLSILFSIIIESLKKNLQKNLNFLYFYGIFRLWASIISFRFSST